MALDRLNLETYAVPLQLFTNPEPGSRGRYLLDAPYQRGDEWEPARQRNLVRSILMGLPIGTITINERDHTHNSYDPDVYAAVVDGRQRITAIREFVAGNVAVPAAWFATDDTGVYFDELAGTILDTLAGGLLPAVTYDTLTDFGRARFDRGSLNISHARVTSVEAEAELYLLLNFGGVPQSAADRERADRVATGELSVS